MDRPLVAAVTVAVTTSLAAVASAVWLAVGHPGLDGAPAMTASRADFCAEFASLYDDALAAGPGADLPAFGTTYVAYAQRVGDVGLPTGAPERVWRGFEVFVDAAQQLPPDAETPADWLGTVNISAADSEAYAVFDRWARRTCRER